MVTKLSFTIRRTFFSAASFVSPPSLLASFESSFSRLREELSGRKLVETSHAFRGAATVEVSRFQMLFDLNHQSNVLKNKCFGKFSIFGQFFAKVVWTILSNLIARFHCSYPLVDWASLAREINLKQKIP